MLELYATPAIIQRRKDPAHGIVGKSYVMWYFLDSYNNVAGMN